MASGAVFLERWAGSDRSDSEAAIAAKIDELYLAAQQAWPGVALEPTTFAVGLAQHAATEGPAIAAITAVRATDLYLALACVAGIPEAVAAFRVFDADIHAALRRMRFDDATIADLGQELRERLLIGTSQTSAKLGSYAGRGSLKSWIRSAATRHGLNHLDGRREAAPLTEHVLASVGSTGDPGLDLMKQTYRESFREAVQGALRDLPARDRTLLAQYFVDELTVDELGAIHGTHRATAARWVARAKDAVFQATAARLRATLRVDQHELDSILRLIDSQLELSMGALLAHRH
ncbi:MAG: sigma-70 family RNA polymerase sigma factor [Kofleriaceae bacterium]